MARDAARAVRRIRQVLALGVRLCGLAADARARLEIFATTLALGARWTLKLRSGRQHPLRVREPGGPRTFWVEDFGELEAMRDVVLDEEYALPGLDPRTILDLGANIGVASAWFRERYPQARIVAVEPDPRTFARLERHLAADPRVTLVNAAVAGEPGERTLFRLPGYSIAASLDPARGSAGGSTCTVRACTLDELCDEHGVGQIDLLKLDVEGAELDVLEGFSRLDAVSAIVGEAHPPLLGERLREFWRRLSDFDVRPIGEGPNGILFVAERPR